jgi:hypothetical protein
MVAGNTLTSYLVKNDCGKSQAESTNSVVLIESLSPYISRLLKFAEFQRLLPEYRCFGEIGDW